MTDPPLHSFQAKVRTQTWPSQTPPRLQGHGQTHISKLSPLVPFFLIGLQLIYNIVLISVVQQGESVIHINISTLSDSFPIKTITEY